MADIIQLQNGKIKRTGARRGGETSGYGKSGSRRHELERVLAHEPLDLDTVVDCRGSQMLSHHDTPVNGAVEVCSDGGMVVTLNYSGGRITSAHCG